MFLHCRRLRFLDAAASLVDVEAELPFELKDLITSLRPIKGTTEN